MFFKFGWFGLFASYLYTNTIYTIVLYKMKSIRSFFLRLVAKLIFDFLFDSLYEAFGVVLDHTMFGMVCESEPHICS